MGNKQSDFSANQLEEYNVGDMDKFQCIVDHNMTCRDPRFQTWKLGCLYYALTNSDNHDLGESASTIIMKYQELEANIMNMLESKIPEQVEKAKELIKYLYIATRSNKYEKFLEPNTRVSFMV